MCWLRKTEMNTVLYYLNLTFFPLLALVILVKNLTRLTIQAFEWTASECKEAYRANRRAFKMN